MVMARSKHFNLSKAFGDHGFAVLADLNLRIPREGTLFGFLGPNGSGKSTTIRDAHRILPPTIGESSSVDVPLFLVD